MGNPCSIIIVLLFYFTYTQVGHSAIHRIANGSYIDIVTRFYMTSWNNMAPLAFVLFGSGTWAMMPRQYSMHAWVLVSRTDTSHGPGAHHGLDARLLFFRHSSSLMRWCHSWRGRFMGFAASLRLVTWVLVCVDVASFLYSAEFTCRGSRARQCSVVHKLVLGPLAASPPNKVAGASFVQSRFV